MKTALAFACLLGTASAQSVLLPESMKDEVAEVAKEHPGLKLEFYSSSRDAKEKIATAEGYIGSPDEGLLEAGTKLLHVPYRGGAPAAAAVASGEVALGVVAIPAVIPHMQSGRVKVLGLTTARRSSFNKDWVTANEAGVKNVDASNWVGLFAPKGVPADVVARLHAEVVKTLEQPDVKKRFADAGAELGGMSSADFGQRIRSDATRFKDIVQKANIRPE